MGIENDSAAGPDSEGTPGLASAEPEATQDVEVEVETAPEGTKAPEKAPLAPVAGDIRVLEKRLKDTQAAMHAHAARASQLERALQAIKSAPASKPADEKPVDFAQAIADGREVEAIDTIIEQRERKRNAEQVAAREQQSQQQAESDAREWATLVELDPDVAAHQAELERLAGKYPDASLSTCWISLKKRMSTEKEPQVDVKMAEARGAQKVVDARKQIEDLRGVEAPARGAGGSTKVRLTGAEVKMAQAFFDGDLAAYARGKTRFK